MKLFSAFFLVVLFSCLAYAENEEMNPYAPPRGKPELLSLRDFEYEYDLAMEKDFPPRFTPYLQRVQVGHGILGLAYTTPLLWVTSHALKYPDFHYGFGVTLAAASILGPTLFMHWALTEDWDNHTREVKSSLLAEARYAHLRDTEAPDSRPLPCRATFAQLANPFRLSRITSRLVPLAIGSGAAVTVEHWIEQDQSTLSGLKSLFFKK